MEDIEKKLTNLESRFFQIKTKQNQQELLAQIQILETLANFYNFNGFDERISKLKENLEKIQGFSKYDSFEDLNKMEIIDEKITRILDTSAYTNECVKGQGELVNRIEAGFETSVNNTVEAREQLERYRNYVMRKNRILRTVIILIIIFLSILGIKIFIH